MVKTIIYVWKSAYPWDIRVEKICKSIQKYGFNVIILAKWKGEKDAVEIIENIKVIRVGFNYPSFLNTALSFNPIWKNAILKVIREYTPNLIIVREIFLASLCGKIGKQYKIPVIIDMAENYPAAMKVWRKYTNHFSTRFLIQNLKYIDKIEKQAAKSVNGIITVCKENSLRVIEKYKFKSDDIIEIHNTFPIKLAESFNIGKNFNPNKITFGHHGNLTDEKKIDIFLKGFLQFAQEFKESKFIIAGDGHSIPELKKIWESANNKTTVIFTGKYNFNELDGIINQIDVGVLPYQVNDFNNFTIHNKLFDYFAAGRPVLTSETAPFKRIINDTKTGAFINCSTPESVYEGLKRFVRLDLKSMSINSLVAFHEKYNWENDEKHLIEFINKFI